MYESGLVLPWGQRIHTHTQSVQAHTNYSDNNNLKTITIRIIMMTAIITRTANVQMIHILHTGLLHSHLHYINNHHATLQKNDCTSSSLPETLSEHQSHSNWNQTVQFSHVQHHTKFETN